MYFGNASENIDVQYAQSPSTYVKRNVLAGNRSTKCHCFVQLVVGLDEPKLQ